MTRSERNHPGLTSGCAPASVARWRSRTRSSGREAELRTLREFLDREGPPHVVFVEGDAGVGKTALLDAVVDGAAMPVLRARPTAAEAASSYAALNDLLQPVFDGVGTLPGPAGDRRRARWRACTRRPGATPSWHSS
jgi:predicted ATPase